MNKSYIIALYCLSLGVTLVWSQTSTPASPTPIAASTNSPTSKPLVVIKPATLGLIFNSPKDSGGIIPITKGAGTRGGSWNGEISVLEPQETALTTQPSPTLYWYQSQKADVHCEIVITEPGNPKPLIKFTSSDAASPAGVHPFRLAKYKIVLQPNVVYAWSAALVFDPKDRSQDMVAHGAIKRIAPTGDLAKAANLRATNPADAATLYATNGIWYDALQTVSDGLVKNPKDETLKADQESLLKQIQFKSSK